MGEHQNQIGREYEKILAKYLNKKFGFWVYQIPPKTNGQPCDIIALKKKVSFLMDAKHVEESKVSFTFDRIEPNQITALAYAHNFAQIENVGFAIYFERDKTWYWLPYDTFLYLHNLKEKSVNKGLLVKLEDVINENLN